MSAARHADHVVDDGTDPDLLRAALLVQAQHGALPALLADLERRGDGVERLPVALPAAATTADADAEARVDGWLHVWSELGVRATVVGDPGHPARLAEGWPIGRMPLVLARRGAPQPDGPAVALVGARRATGYGRGVAAWLAEAAAEAGARVISGGAVGIDAAAHGAAVDLPGATTVVLGCGHDVPYPRPHAREGGLFDRVLDAGGTILAEATPGTEAKPHVVIARNRIIAALADVVVVVEGGARSGALRTAAHAADRGVPVLAVPGDVRAAGSVAPHRLLAEGAMPCTSPRDLLDALHIVATGDDPGSTVSVLPDAIRADLARRWPRPVHRDDLAAALGLDVGTVLAALTRARVAGEVAEGPDGVRLCRAPTT